MQIEKEPVPCCPKCGGRGDLMRELQSPWGLHKYGIDKADIGFRVKCSQCGFEGHGMQACSSGEDVPSLFQYHVTEEQAREKAIKFFLDGVPRNRGNQECTVNR